MVKVVVYSTRYCGYCVAAKRLLTAKGVAFEDLAIDLSPQLREQMQALTRRTSVPQIFIDDQHVGGCQELYELDQSGELDELLTPTDECN